MSPSEFPTRPSTRLVVREVYVDQVERNQPRHRFTGMLTLIVAGAWLFGAYKVYKEVGTLLIAGGFSTLIGGLSAEPLPTLTPTSASAPATSSAPATQPVSPDNPVALLLDPFSTTTTTTTATTTRSAGRRRDKTASAQAAEAVKEIVTWGEGIRHVWVAMMGIIGAGMILVGLFALAGSDKAPALHHALAWVIIAATLATFVAISLLIDKAGFPPRAPAVYAVITLVHSGYGWFLLFFESALFGESVVATHRD